MYRHHDSGAFWPQILLQSSIIPLMMGGVFACGTQASTPPSPSKFSLEGAAPLNEGDSSQLRAVSDDGQTLQDVRWKSSNPDVIDVSVAGALLARGPGTATITAMAGSQAASTDIPVKRQPLPDLYVVAHRGFAGVFPENTLVAVRGAFDRGADAVEVDVAMANDRVPIIMHDDRVDRTTNGTGYVRDLTSGQLQQLDACSKFGSHWGACPVPLATEVMDAARGRGRLLLHLKGPWPDGALDTLVQLVESKGIRHQAVVIDYDANTLAHVRRVDPAITVGLLTMTMVDSMALHRLGNAVLLFFDSVVVANPQSTVTDIRNEAISRGNSIGAFTIYGLARAKQVRAKGAGWLITDVELSKDTLNTVPVP